MKDLTLHHTTFQLNITEDHPIMAPTKARLEKAKLLATTICQLATHHLTCHALQCAWLLTVRLLVYKLVFDCRISSPTHIAPFATALDNLVAKCLATISGHATLTPAHLLQASLPGKLGGLFLTSSYHTAHIAPLASFLQCANNTAVWLQTNTSCTTPLEHISTLPIALSLLHLKKFKIHITHDGSPDNTLTQHTFSTHQLPPTRSNMQSKLMEAFHTHARSVLLDMFHHSERDLARIRSCGGCGNAEFLRTPPTDPHLRLTDAEIRVTLRWRLGLPILPPGATCMHLGATKMCTTLMDTFADHPITCKLGAWTQERHDAIRDLITHFCSIAKLCTHVETYVPELAQVLRQKHSTNTTTHTLGDEVEFQEARMDVIAAGGVPHTTFWIDSYISSNCCIVPGRGCAYRRPRCRHST